MLRERVRHGWIRLSGHNSARPDDAGRHPATLAIVDKREMGQTPAMSFFDQCRIYGCWIVCFAWVTPAYAGETGAPLPSWAELLDRAKLDHRLTTAREELVQSARELLAKPIIVRRAKKISDINQPQAPLDSVQRPDGLLFLVFTAPESDLQRYDGTFHHMLRSVRIKR